MSVDLQEEIVVSMVNDDHRYYITQSESILHELTNFTLEKERKVETDSPLIETYIPKRNGERSSWIMGPSLHARFARIGAIILGEMPGYLSELGGKSLFGHIPVEGTLLLENSSRSYGEGLDKKQDMWNRGMRYGIYLDIKEAYNSVSQSLVVNMLDKHISEGLAIDYFLLSCYFKSGNSIPHGYTTSHSIFYLVRAEVYQLLPEYRENILILNDDIYIFGKTLQQAQTIQGELLKVLWRLGLSENTKKTRQFGSVELENGTWAFDMTKSRKEANTLLIEILRHGDWRIWRTASSRNRFLNNGCGGLSSSTEGVGKDDGILSELDQNERYKLLWEDLAEVNYSRQLDRVDSTVLTKCISILDKYSSDSLIGKEMRYLQESSYACSQIFEYSVNRGSLSGNPTKFWGEVDDCHRVHPFAKSLFTERLGKLGFLNSEESLLRLADLVLDPYESPRHRTTALRAIKTQGYTDLWGSVSLMIGESECMSLNLETIDALKYANRHARARLLNRFSAIDLYRQAIEMRVA